MRPSSSTTVSASREQDTSTATASLLATKVGIPSLQEKISILLDHLRMPSTHGFENPVRRSDGIEPELRNARHAQREYGAVTIFQAVEEEPVPSNPRAVPARLSLHLPRCQNKQP